MRNMQCREVVWGRETVVTNQTHCILQTAWVKNTSLAARLTRWTSCPSSGKRLKHNMLITNSLSMFKCHCTYLFPSCHCHFVVDMLSALHSWWLFDIEATIIVWMHDENKYLNNWCCFFAWKGFQRYIFGDCVGQLATHCDSALTETSTAYTTKQVKHSSEVYYVML